VFSASAFAAQITTTHTSAKVLPKASPPPNVPVDLVAARNEFASFQLVVHADEGPLSEVRATFEAHGGPRTIDASNVQMYREEFLDLEKASFPNTPAGRWPDPLVPDRDETVGEQRNAFPFNVPAGESRAIWIDVLVPQKAAPGKYQGAVQVEGSGFKKSVPVKLTVLPTELPSTSSLDTAFLFHWPNACRAHTGTENCGGEEASYELTSKYQRLALEHRVTLPDPLLYPSNGDWENFDRRYGPWLEGTAPSRLPGAKMTSVQFTRYIDQRPDPALLKAFEQHMKERGWLDRAYDYTGDEPPYGITFEEARARAEAVKSAAPELRTLITTSLDVANQHGFTPNLDVFVPIINFMDGIEPPYVGDQRRKYDALLADGKKTLWLYQACPSHGCTFGTTEMENKPGAGWPSYMVDASAARNRAMQWLVFLEDASGELYYETALVLPDAWKSVYAFGGNGDGTLFYPGQRDRIGGSTEVPLPSIRLKQIRQGMQDYEWLKKVADAGDPEFARETARALIPRAHQVGDDGASFEAARLRLMARWIKLTRGAPGKTASGNSPAVAPDAERSSAANSAAIQPDDPALTRCIPSDSPNGEPQCPNSDFWKEQSGGKAGCTSAAGIPSALALLGLVGASVLRRFRKR
jgi:Domain of unknown function (DUF4091)